MNARRLAGSSPGGPFTVTATMLGSFEGAAHEFRQSLDNQLWLILAAVSFPRGAATAWDSGSAMGTA